MKFKCFSLNGFAGDRTAEGMRECHALAHKISTHFGIDVEYRGQPSPVADLNWDKALIKSKLVFTMAAQIVSDALRQKIIPLVVTPRCATAISTLPQVISEYPDCVIVYLDAHGDLTTPKTSESGYLGGMPISAVLGFWESGYGSGLKPEQLIHVGGRDFDECEVQLLNKINVVVISKEELEKSLVSLSDLIKNKPVYVHIDVDSFDPSEVVAEYSVEGGLYRNDVKSILKAITDNSNLVGLEIAEFSPKNDHEREHSYTALLESLEGLAIVPTS